MNARGASCPLSGDRNLILIDTLQTDDLVRLYAKNLNTKTGSEFGNIAEIGFYRSSASDLMFFYPTVAGSEGFYEQLQRFDWYYPDEKSEYDYAKEFISSKDSVLEIGCGKGVFANIIRPAMYVGLEFSRKAQEEAVRNGLTVLNESIEQHASKQQRLYDVVCAFQVLEHVVEVRQFIEQGLRCVRPGGLLIFSVPCADSFVAVMPNHILNLPPHHSSWWTEGSLRFVARLFGLDVVGIGHEKMPAPQQAMYAHTVVLGMLRSWLGMQKNNHLIDRSLAHRILNPFAAVGGKILSRGLRDPRLLPYGQSVTAVYRKRSDQKIEQAEHDQ